MGLETFIAERGEIDRAQETVTQQKREAVKTAYETACQAMDIHSHYLTQKTIQHKRKRRDSWQTPFVEDSRGREFSIRQIGWPRQGPVFQLLVKTGNCTAHVYAEVDREMREIDYPAENPHVEQYNQTEEDMTVQAFAETAEVLNRTYVRRERGIF